MKDRKTVIKNYLFNTSYQVLTLIVPLITTPYISRVLQADGIGIYSYTYSIVTYFTMFSILGTATFGNRHIGILQDDPVGRTKKFWDIFTLRLITSMIALALYCGYVILFADNKAIAWIQAIYILAVTFDVVWFFQGMEDFKRIAIRNYVFKIINVASIFIFVKTADDLWKYTLSLSSIMLIGNASILPFLKKYLVRLHGYKPKPFDKFSQVLQLLIPTVSGYIYEMLDKTMIGAITHSDAQNGYYEQSLKIVKMCLMLVTTISTVLLPKVSKAYAEDRIDDAREYLYQSYNFVWFLATPLMFGVIAISDTLVPVFFGQGFDEDIKLLPIMSLLFIFMGLASISSGQYFTASGRQNISTRFILIGGAVNMVLNLMLIPNMQSQGAAIASVTGEIVIALLGLIYIHKKKMLSIFKIVAMSWKYMVSGVLMLAIIRVETHYLQTNAMTLAILIISGAIVYFVTLIVERDRFILSFINKGIDIIKSKISR